MLMPEIGVYNTQHSLQQLASYLHIIACYSNTRHELGPDGLAILSRCKIRSRLSGVLIYTIGTLGTSQHHIVTATAILEAQSIEMLVQM